jgi:tetraacyldisaccharide 4'-kinase
MTIRVRLEHLLLRNWVRRGWVAWFLRPVSLLFEGLVRFRQQLYHWGILRSYSVDACVLVVGNVVAGGAGKTPTVINIIQHLQSRNLRCGVVSRGYGGNVTQATPVLQHSNAHEVGDEPLLIQRTTGVPIWVGPSRLDATRCLLRQHPDTKVIVCDDGLQHYALHRDIEVCVFDSRGYGNGWCLPAGPLREPWPVYRIARAGQRADNLLVLHTGTSAFAGFVAHRSLAEFVTDGHGNHQSFDSALQSLAKPLLALAGIAQPDRFFTMLQQRGAPLSRTEALPDHARLHDIDAKWAQDYQIICTEKDAVKLWPLFPDVWAVALIQEPEAGFFEALDTAITHTLQHRKRNHHGYTNA